MFFQCSRFRRYFNTRRLDLRLIRLSRHRVYQLSVSSTAGYDSLQICRLRFLKGGLHFNSEGLQWSKIVEIRKTQMRQITIKSPDWAFALHAQIATAPRKQPQPAKSRQAPDGVYGSAGCARQQSQAARNDSRDIFVKSKLRKHKTLKKRSSKASSYAVEDMDRKKRFPSGDKIRLSCAVENGPF